MLNNRTNYRSLRESILSSVGFENILSRPPDRVSVSQGHPHSRNNSHFVEQRFPCARWTPSKEDPTQFNLESVDLTTPWLTVDPSILKPDETDDLIRNCKPVVVTIQPGEVLYLPALWFHSVSQKSNSYGLCVAVNYWYDMDFTGPLYPMFNFLRNITMIENGQSEEIHIDTD